MKSPNIILVLLDGARWDRINKSQEFQKIISKGVLLNNVNTAIPYTIGSVNTIFSGLYGKENGVDAYYKMFKLKESVKILPEILKENGYFTACDLLSGKIISKRGFDIHQFHDEYHDDLRTRHPNFIKKCLNDAKEKPVFIFLHFTRIHTVTVSETLKKYEWNDKKFYERKNENLINYDKVFDEAGKYASLIKETLEELETNENTILIFFSDHGTGVGERFGERNYGSFTYEETIRSFYLFLGGKILKGKKTEKLCETLDIMPTILELIGINSIKLPGKSFAKFLSNENESLADKNYVYSETGALQGPYPSPMKPNVFCVKNSKYKLIFFETPNEWRLYNLKNDPLEEKNIIGKMPEIEKELKEKLLLWIKR